MSPPGAPVERTGAPAIAGVAMDAEATREERRESSSSGGGGLEGTNDMVKEEERKGEGKAQNTLLRWWNGAKGDQTFAKRTL